MGGGEGEGGELTFLYTLGRLSTWPAAPANSPRAPVLLCIHSFTSILIKVTQNSALLITGLTAKGWEERGGGGGCKRATDLMNRRGGCRRAV